jgi:tetratricopeptide (TPR) repeat protein
MRSPVEQPGARAQEGSIARAAAEAIASDPISARGNMWGSEIGESFGAAGLGLSGIGQGGGATGPSSVGSGGGGRGEGIGLGSVGTIGRGAGAGVGQGFGSGSGRLGGSHRAQLPQVRMGATSVSGRLPPEVIQRVMRQNFGRFRQCYQDALRRQPNVAGRIVLRFAIDRGGVVSNVGADQNDFADGQMRSCLTRAVYGLSFPAPEGGVVTVAYPILFSPEGTMLPPSSTAIANESQNAPPREPDPPKPIRGPLSEVLDAIAEHHPTEAIAKAGAWHAKEPGEVLALVGLGAAFEASGELDQAARAYGSIIDLYPWRADMRRFAGGHLEHVAQDRGMDLAIDSYLKARDERPDHPSSHRMLAMAWLKKGQPEKAFDVLQAALARRYPNGRFAGVDQILREDLGLVAAAWIKAEPKRRAAIESKLDAAGGVLELEPSLRFVLSWETDSNDVDLHVYDAVGGHAYYSDKSLQSGGNLYADVTTGYGPECFTVRSPDKKRNPSYRLKAQYYAQGPMGYGMGKVEIVRHDGQGGLRFEERPFLLMNGGSAVELGAVEL